jgi:hypothetical protein
MPALVGRVMQVIVRDSWCDDAPEVFRADRARRTLRQMSNADEPGMRLRLGRRARPLAAIATLIVMLAVVALPTLAADPSASPDTPSSAEPQHSAAVAPSAEPERSGEPEVSAEPEESAEPDDSAAPAERAAEPEEDGKPDKGHKDKAPEHPVTLQGTVTTGTDEDGDPSYELASGGKTYQLDAGPPWFYGDNHPLKPFVGQSVTLTGEAAEGSTEVDVLTVNGTVIREPGKPPWAGGWKRVGENHPGWSEEKAARWAEKTAKQGQKSGDCWPPGHCKQQDEAETGVEPTH